MHTSRPQSADRMTEHTVMKSIPPVNKTKSQRQAEQKAIGCIRRALAEHGIKQQSSAFRHHGYHTPDRTAPLILVACSGGRDSLALAYCAQTVAGELGVRCGAIIVDHQLQKGSAEVARYAADQCKRMHMDPVIVTSMNVETRTGDGEEAAARHVRYEAICACAKKLHAKAVLLAHTQDDQAETMMLAILQGSSPTALTGMPAPFIRDGVQFLRPILGVTRLQTTAICEAESLSWWDDPTNGDGLHIGDLGFSELPRRSQVRQSLIPLLRQLGGPAVTAHLAALAQSQREDQDYLAAVARKAFLSVCESSDPQQSDPQQSHQHYPQQIRFVTRKLRELARPIRLRVLMTGLAVLVGGTPDTPNMPGTPGTPSIMDTTNTSRERLRSDGINRSALNVLDRYVMGDVPSPKCQISRNFSAYRQTTVIVLCHNDLHADR